MNYLDIYHRALKDYRRSTVQNRDCDKQRSATIKANDKQDHVTLVQKICHVETEWIEAIEQGLEHVEKAIREDRQFIRSNGEVVDIEKVRSVSKDSVKHLAEHSDLITRYEEGEDIIPDRLYIVERLNDYAVYENRFLYMMLCYLRDFITLRYNEIVEIEHTYNGSMEMHKNIHMPKRNLVLNIDLQEVKKNDPYLAERSTSKKIIARIRDILELVHSYLSTPLMSEVSKVPMIKPPVTRTNVLRMNRNFRGALALYEYVSAYDKPGYTIEEKVTKIQPFKPDMADEFSEVVLLSSFLTYKHSMAIGEDLQASYEQEEERRREEEAKRHQEHLKELRRRIAENAESPEEYMLLLERRNRALEADHEALIVAHEQIEQMQATIDDLTRRNEEQGIAIENLKELIERMKIAHEAELKALEEEYEAKIKALHEEYQAKIQALHEEYRVKIEEIHADYQKQIEQLHEDYARKMEAIHAEYKEQIEKLHTAYQGQLNTMREDYEGRLGSIRGEYEEQMARMTTEYETEIETLKTTHEETVNRMQNEFDESTARATEQYESRISELETTLQSETDRLRQEAQNLSAMHQVTIQTAADMHQQEKGRLQGSLDETTSKLSETEQRCAELLEARRLAEARLLALRAEHGLTTSDDDFTSKEAFEELEHQFKVFKSLFGKEWKKTKKNIRKNTLATYKEAVRAGTDQDLIRQMTEEEPIPEQTETPTTMTQEHEEG